MIYHNPKRKISNYAAGSHCIHILKVLWACNWYKKTHHKPKPQNNWSLDANIDISSESVADIGMLAKWIGSIRKIINPWVACAVSLTE